MPLAIREIEIKITLTFPLTPERMAKVKKQVITHTGKTDGKKEPFYTIGGNVN